MTQRAISEALVKLRSQINSYCSEAGRAPNSVQVIAVSKNKPLSMIQAAYALGQKHFAESYVQEAIPKINAFSPPDLVWHFIGPIQSNKTKLIAEHVTWVHSIDRLKIAERLSKQRPDILPALNICIEVNINGETTKSGVMLEELTAFALAIQTLPRLRLRGLMAIPAKTESFTEQRLAFAKLNSALQELCRRGIALDTLSMGMSNDFKAAIFEGATFIRIGTAIFSAR